MASYYMAPLSDSRRLVRTLDRYWAGKTCIRLLTTLLSIVAMASFAVAMTFYSQAEKMTTGWDGLWQPYAADGLTCIGVSSRSGRLRASLTPWI